MKYLSIFSLLFLLLFISSVQASTLGIFPQNTCIQLHQICSNCTYVNLTSVSYPSGMIEFHDVNMEKNTNDYNYTFCNTSVAGNYLYNTCGDLNDGYYCENIDFSINRVGEELTTSKSIFYSLLAVFVFIIFLISLWPTFGLPGFNQLNEGGEVAKIVKLKYIKYGCILISYALFVSFLNLLIGLSDSFLKLTLFYGFIEFVFSTLLRLSWPMFIIIFVWAFMNIIWDLKLRKELDRLFNEGTPK